MTYFEWFLVITQNDCRFPLGEEKHLVALLASVHYGVFGQVVLDLEVVDQGETLVRAEALGEAGRIQDVLVLPQ